MPRKSVTIYLDDCYEKNRVSTLDGNGDNVRDVRKYYIGMSINDYYAVHIIDDGYETTEMVQENDLDGFIQCLEHFGFHI